METICAASRGPKYTSSGQPTLLPSFSVYLASYDTAIAIVLGTHVLKTWTASIRLV